MRFPLSVPACSILLFMAAPGAPLAQDAFYGSPDSSMSFSAGIGLTSIKAGEFVYDGGHKLSQLDWESKNIRTLNLGGEVEIGYGWRLRGKFDIGTGGNGDMVDKDWLVPAISDWTHQSIHPDTRLSHYLNGSIEADRAVYDNGSTMLSVGAGFGYTDIKWDSYGGSYIYSVNTLHDTVGSFDPDEKGISYQQKIPTAFLTANAEHRIDGLTLAAGLKGGMAFNYRDTDDHWLRSLRFYDDLGFTPMLGASLSATQQITDTMSIYVSGDFEKVFEGKGDTRVVDTGSGAYADFADAAGADYQKLSVSVGLKSRF